MSGNDFNINKRLDEIGRAVLTAITYRKYPLDQLEIIINSIDTIIGNSSYLEQCEQYLKSLKSNYILFFLSNIIYNLKKRGELVLTPEALIWLGGVWKNFLKRNKSYQELFPLIDEHRNKLKRHYPAGGIFVSQIENVSLVKEEFIDTLDTSENNLNALEKFYQHSSELMTWMKPTFFFLIDFYYECKLATGKDIDGSAEIEAKGLLKFGETGYNYGDIALLTCQALGVLEATYLILKKKKATRRIVSIEGRQKFLTPPEIYNAYLDRFNAMKKEISNLNK